MIFTDRALAGIILCPPSGVKPFPKTPELRPAVIPTNRLVKGKNGKKVRKFVKSRIFPRIQWPHPDTVGVLWPEDDLTIKKAALRAMASDWEVPGRSKARSEKQLRKLLKDWRAGV